MIKLISSFVIVACSLICQSSAAQIKLDGVVKDGEWKNAKAIELFGGGRGYFKMDGDQLLVALQGSEKGWAHVYISSGDSVWVRHASAALGQSVYARASSWSIVEQFNWQLRDRIYDAETENKMSDYFRSNGWVANNNNIGDGKTLEFKIDLNKYKNKPVYFACFYASDPKQPHYYPLNLKDDTIAEQLVYGNAQASLQFSPENWVKIR